MYGMILIFIQLPWVVLKGKNYSIYAAYFRIKSKGIKAFSEMAASVWDGNITIIRIQLILLIVFQIVIVLHIVTQWLHKEYYLNIAALVVLGVYIVVNESGFGMLADNLTKTILIPAIIMIFVMAEVLISKILDVWKDAKESAEIFAEKEREEKEDTVREVVQKAFSSPEIQDWYSGEWTLFNECAIIYKEKGILQTRRPDRVMMKDGQVVVVDFKFGKENPKYNKQVKGYMQLLTKMGYKNITGYLWYVDEEKIEKV